MFYGEEYNLPPCCCQNYFRSLWQQLQTPPIKLCSKEHLMEGLTETEAEKLISQVEALGQTTSMYVLSDFTLQQVLSHVVIKVPMAHLSLMVPDITEDLIEVLAGYLSKSWYKDSKHQAHKVEKLTLVSSEASIMENMNFIRDVLAPYKDRVVLAKANCTSLILHIKNYQNEFVFTGTTGQTIDMSAATLSSLQASSNPDIIKENATVIRLQSHHKVTF